MMRYEKKVAWLSGALAALLLVWGAGMVFSPERSAARSESKKLLSAKAEEVASISIGPLSLAKESGSWFLDEGGAKLPVQEARVKSFLETASKAARLKPMAKTKAAWASFGLDEGKAIAVLVKDGKGKTLADFAVGGYAAAAGEVYLRLAGSEASYSVDGSIASYARGERSSWLDLRVVPGPLPESDVEGISVKASIALDGAGKPPLAADYSLKRGKDGTWGGLPGTIDGVAVSTLLRSVLNIEGEDIVAAPPATSFTPVAARIELSLGNGGNKVIEVGTAAGDGRFYLRLAGGKYVYAVSSYGLRNALKKPQDLVAKK
jgi:hypothetical protein